jgi:hypothetical protein
VGKGETVEIANIHAGFVYVAENIENIVGWQERLGEYPTISAIPIKCTPNGVLDTLTQMATHGAESRRKQESAKNCTADCF